MPSSDGSYLALREAVRSLSILPLLNLRTMTPEAEKFNGWMAMIGFIAAVGAYMTTGQIIPGIF
tara:strand:- start:246 stop:437 length:192 start_codon:yes stop_codon:yes gene_type:complete